MSTERPQCQVNGSSALPSKCKKASETSSCGWIFSQNSSSSIVQRAAKSLSKLSITLFLVKSEAWEPTIVFLLLLHSLIAQTRFNATISNSNSALVLIFLPGETGCRHLEAFAVVLFSLLFFKWKQYSKIENERFR